MPVEGQVDYLKRTLQRLGLARALCQAGAALPQLFQEEPQVLPFQPPTLACPALPCPADIFYALLSHPMLLFEATFSTLHCMIHVCRP